MWVRSFVSLWALLASSGVVFAQYSDILSKALVSQEELLRAQDLMANGVSVTVREYIYTPNPGFRKEDVKILLYPLSQYPGSLENLTLVVRRMSLMHEDLLAIFPRDVVLRYLKGMVLCLNSGCGFADTKYGMIHQSASPQNFHGRVTSDYLKNREERLADIHEFMHLLDLSKAIDVTSFGAISWQSRKVRKLGMDKFRDFVTTYAFYNNYNEDVAESVGWYVFHREEFLYRAQSSPILAQKYEWVKNNVFGGKEFKEDGIRLAFNVPVSQSSEIAVATVPQPTPQIVTPSISQTTTQPVIQVVVAPTSSLVSSETPSTGESAIDRALVTQDEKARVKDLLANNIQITIMEMKSSGSGKDIQYQVIKSKLKDYGSSVKNETDVVRRLGMFHEDLQAVFGRELLLKHIRRLDVCVDMGCSASSWQTGAVFLPASRKYYRTVKNDTPFSLSDREERLYDIHEFALFLDGLKYTPAESFMAFSWDGKNLKKRASNATANDFVTAFAYKTNAFQDLGQTVGWYVFRRDEFLAKAKSSLMLSRKYDWVRDNVFGGREFTLDVLNAIFLK